MLPHIFVSEEPDKSKHIIFADYIKKQKPCNLKDCTVFLGVPEWIRTTGPQFRKLLLYPTELRKQTIYLNNDITIKG
jgi:hypothetical protein